MIGLNTAIWGPSAWLFLHSITLSYPENPTPEDKERVKAFFQLCGQLLPCRYCRENFSRHTRMYPIRNGSRGELVSWLIDVHNMVNLTLGKPTLPKDQALKKILNVYRKETQNPEGVYYLYLGILLLLLGVCYIRR